MALCSNCLDDGLNAKPAWACLGAGGREKAARVAVLGAQQFGQLSDMSVRREPGAITVTLNQIANSKGWE